MEPQEIKIDKRSKEYRAMKESGQILQGASPTIVPEVDPTAVITVKLEDIPPSFPDNISIIPEEVVEQPQELAKEEVIKEPQKQKIMTTVTAKAPVKSKTIKGTVSIKPYISDQPNMGLELYGEVLFPGAEQRDVVGCDVRDNIKTYITGLNEFAPEIQSIINYEEKLAKIRDIRETIVYLENTANANFSINVDSCMDGYGTKDDKFWENVTMFQSVCVDKFDAKGNRIPTYWDKINLVLTNKGRDLNLKDPHDLAIYHVIEAGGFCLVANSLEKAMVEGGYNFYLHKIENVAAIKTEFKKLRNKAGACLEDMLTNKPTKLFYMAKLCAPMGSSIYKMGGETYTPYDQLYDDLCNYIDGKTLEQNAQIAVKEFLRFYDMSEREQEIRCIIKDATEHKWINIKGNGQLYCVANDDIMGKNIEESVAHLKNPLYGETLNILSTKVKRSWAN